MVFPHLLLQALGDFPVGRQGVLRLPLRDGDIHGSKVSSRAGAYHHATGLTEWLGLLTFGDMARHVSERFVSEASGSPETLPGSWRGRLEPTPRTTRRFAPGTAGGQGQEPGGFDFQALPSLKPELEVVSTLDRPETAAAVASSSFQRRRRRMSAGQFYLKTDLSRGRPGPWRWLGANGSAAGCMPDQRGQGQAYQAELYWCHHWGPREKSAGPTTSRVERGLPELTQTGPPD